MEDDILSLNVATSSVKEETPQNIKPKYQPELLVQNPKVESRDREPVPAARSIVPQDLDET